MKKLSPTGQCQDLDSVIARSQTGPTYRPDTVTKKMHTCHAGMECLVSVFRDLPTKQCVSTPYCHIVPYKLLNYRPQNLHIKPGSCADVHYVQMFHSVIWGQPPSLTVLYDRSIQVPYQETCSQSSHFLFCCSTLFCCSDENFHATDTCN